MTTTTDLATYPPDEPAKEVTATGAVMKLTEWVQELNAAHTLASALCNTGLVPQAYRGKPDDGAVAILTGYELGLSPVAALKNIIIVNGRSSMYAQTMAALLQSRGHKIWTEESTSASVTVSARRKGSSKTETVTWTMERAQRAGYTSNKRYATNPEQMLYARCVSEVAPRVAADVILGIATVEDLQDEAAREEAQTVTAPSRRVQRKAKAKEDPVPEKPTVPGDLMKHMFGLLDKLIEEPANTDEGKVKRLDLISDAVERDVPRTADLTEEEVRTVVEVAEEAVRSLDAEAPAE